MTYHGSEGCQGVKGGTQGAPAAAGGAKLLPPGGQSYFLSNGWSKSIVLENKVAINFDFRSGAKKSGHLDYPLQSYGPKFVNMPKYAPYFLKQLILTNRLKMRFLMRKLTTIKQT